MNKQTTAISKRVTRLCTYAIVSALALYIACSRAEETLTSQVSSEYYAIIYFGRDTCKASRQQAEVLKEVEARYGLPILPVTLDGGKLHLFPDTKPDNGFSIVVSRGEGITRTPTLYLIARNLNRAIPLSDSLLEKEEIVSRINKITAVLEAAQTTQR
jgi:conjugal transfer pilus assembly protein TraF